MARFTNQAQLRYGNAVANSNIAVGEILEVLAVTKTAVRSNYRQNDTITYVISIVNSGTAPVTGLTITDNLGEYAFGTQSLAPLSYVANTVRYYTNGSLQAAPAVAVEAPLTITGISVPAGGNAVVVYEALVNEYAPLSLNSQIKNTVTVSGTGITDISADETVTALSEPMLTITKSVSPVPVTENGTLTYTFTIQNYGSQPADESTGVVITDTFAPILNNLTASFNAAAWTPTTDYIYGTATGLFSSVEGKITVPAATYVQDEMTGAWSINPGVSTLVITGTV